MSLVFACIASHVAPVLPESAGGPNDAPATRNAMMEIGRRMESLRPDTVVIVTPHGVRIDGMISISVSTRAEGGLGGGVVVDFEVDQALASAIAIHGEAAGVPVARCSFGTFGGPGCCLPLDFGAIIPLRFMGQTFEHKPQVVVVCPSRSLSREQMVTFGQAIARAAQESGRRVALIASADQSHAHAADGPNGFSPSAAEYDRQMCRAVEDQNLLQLLETDSALMEEAKPDSLWQMLILAGALQLAPMRGDLLSYEVPSFFATLTAAYQPG